MADLLVPHLSNIRCPVAGEKVYKDECAYSFDTPESETGLYICMNTFLGLGKNHVERHFQKTGNAVFLHLRRRRKQIKKSEDAPPQKKPTRLAIGVEGGFDTNEQSVFLEENTITILPTWTVIPLPNEDLPEMVQMCISGVLAAEDALKLEAAAAMAGTWDGETRVPTRHAENLFQLDNGKKIPPCGWKCEKCDLTANLWLNLTDGVILCGRSFFDGSGGNNHALEHYQQTKYPLTVKLGTITADGADIYSYDEDDMVADPNLSKHLAHFGINMAALEKTEKTMIELEIDLNQKVGEWDVIQEVGSQLKPLYGAGLTGMRNLGNSCYMNSVMQVIFTIPDFKKRYYDVIDEIFSSSPNDPTSDFNTQMAKLSYGLLSSTYSKPLLEEDGEYLPPPQGIRPMMFKTLIGRGHQEFSTKRQQDAQDFFLHLISVIERNSVGTYNPTECFRYKVEEKVRCIQSGKVKYSYRTDFLFSVPVPLEAAVNKAEVVAYEKKKQEFASQQLKMDPKDLVRSKIPLSACIEAFAAVETVDDFFSTALQAKSVVHKSTRFASFPDYLMVQLKKFTVGEDWAPKKLDVSIDIPDELDLSLLRGHGLQPGEEELPTDVPAEPEIQIDDAIVYQLMDMGFPLEASRRGAYYTQSNSLEAATNWVMEHMDDPDFASPFELPESQAKSSSFVPVEEYAAAIQSMGFSREQAVKALAATDNNIERAADWIFSHPEELEIGMDTGEPAAGTIASSELQYRDGAGKYKLVGFISHMGTSSMVGHYVCHIRKEDNWVIFNDEKVALSEHPPKDLAYLYLYQRI